MLHLFDRFGWDLRGYPFHVINWPSSESFQELKVVILIPFEEALVSMSKVLLLKFIGDLLEVFLMLVDLEGELLDFSEVRIELKLEVLIFLRNELVLLGLWLPACWIFIVVLLLRIDSSLFKHFVERISVNSLNRSLPLITALVVKRLVLHFQSILLRKNGMNFFLLLSEILVLKHELVDFVKIEVESIIILHQLDLLISLSLQLLMLFKTFLDEFVNIDIGSIDLLSLLSHNCSGTMDENFLIFLL